MPRPEVDLDAIAGALARTFPEVDASTCRLLAWGDNSIVIETAAGMVFRVGRHEGSYPRYEVEHGILSVVGARVPVAVPDMRWIAGPSELLPYGVSGYRKLAGVPLSPKDVRTGGALTGDLGGFLAALHAIPPSEVPVRTSDAARRRRADLEMHDAVFPALREALSATEMSMLDAWWERYLAEETMMSFAPMMTHGDLWHENLLVDGDGRLVGVIDWEIALIGDPARDFAGLRHLGDAFLREVLGAYAAAAGSDDAALLHRITLVHEIRMLYGVHHAVVYKMPGEFEESVLHLRAGPIFAGRGQA
jgi:aminoglycoside phosphotransferase (APT) family kinase protein